MTNKVFKKNAWLWHFSSVPLGELNRDLEWKPNTNQGNKVNSNRWKKSSGRHLVSRDAPCRESRDDWKKRKNGKSERKKLKGKLPRATFSWFVQSGQSMHEWNLGFSNLRVDHLGIKYFSPLCTAIFPPSHLCRDHPRAEKQWRAVLWPEILVGHSWLSCLSRTEE